MNILIPIIHNFTHINGYSYIPSSDINISDYLKSMVRQPLTFGELDSEFYYSISPKVLFDENILVFFKLNITL